MSEKTFQLLTQKGPAPGKVYTLSDANIIVGRDPSSGLVIEDLEVSRQHARLIKGGAGYVLQDMGSTNGSFVDGERLGGEPVQLKAGQVVMFGSNVELIYQVIADIDPMATMIAPAAAMAKLESKPEPVEKLEPALEPDLDFDDLPDFGVEDALPEIDEPAPLPETEPLAEEEPGFATVIDPSPALGASLGDDLPDFSAELEEDALPDFGSAPAEPAQAEAPPQPAAPPPLPSFDSAPPAGGGKPPKSESSGGFFSNRRNVIIVVVVALLLLCCCVILVVGGLVANGTIQLDNSAGEFFALAPVWVALLL